MKKIALFITAMHISFYFFGQPNETEVTADIKEVVIYNSSVEILYFKEVSLSKGKNTVVFSNLTPYIVENTLNVSLEGNAEIITVNERINYIKERKEINKKISGIEDSIKFIENELGLLKCKFDALNAEKGLLFKDESIGGVSKGVAVSEIEKASIFFNKRYSEIVTELYKIGNDQVKYHSDLESYKNQMSELTSNSSKACSEVVVNVNCQNSAKVTFNFKFLSPMGGWAPSYDCKYQGSNQPISFIFRANVFNSTGIPWDNVSLVLSTANPTVGFEKPSFSNSRSKRNQSVNQNNGVQFKDIEVANSIAEYNIKNKYTIPSDSKPYLIEVDVFEIKAEYYYLLIPKLDPFGFLIAKVPNWNKYNLIPGTTNIYNKGSFMGKTFLNTYAENDTLNIYLGKDNSLLTVRKETSTSNDNLFIGNYSVDKSSINISIKNNTSETLPVQVLDQIPYFYDYEKTKLNIQNIDQAVYDKNEGLLTWNLIINKGETLQIDYKYEIKSPKYERGKAEEMKKMKYRTISCPAF